MRRFLRESRRRWRRWRLDRKIDKLDDVLWNRYQMRPGDLFYLRENLRHERQNARYWRERWVEALQTKRAENPDTTITVRAEPERAAQLQQLYQEWIGAMQWQEPYPGQAIFQQQAPQPPRQNAIGQFVGNALAGLGLGG